MTMKVVSASEDDFRFADDIVVNAEEVEEAGDGDRPRQDKGGDKQSREIKIKGQRLEEVENLSTLEQSSPTKDQNPRFFPG